MTFIWPMMLLFLLLIPLFVMLYLRMQQRRRQLATRYGTLGQLREGAGRPLGRRRHIPPALFLIGLAILLFALARPQTVVSLPRLEGTVILAFDVSGSMAADDLEPTRMEAAKTAALAFVDRQPLACRSVLLPSATAALLSSRRRTSRRPSSLPSIVWHPSGVRRLVRASL